MQSRERGGFWMLQLALLVFTLFVIKSANGAWMPKDADVERWKLFKYGDQTIPLYLKNNVREFLRLCLDKNGKYGEEKCPANEDKVNCIEKCEKKGPDGTFQRLEALKYAKGKVLGIHNFVNNWLRTGTLWIIWFSCCFIGLYLNVKGHYQWVNLPIVGNWLLDSPTDGIKFRHYMWMKWIILGDSNIHWKTYLKSDSFIYNWVPLKDLPWDRPTTPEAKRKNEPRDSEHPEWKIEDVIEEKGLRISQGELDEGWEKPIKLKILRNPEMSIMDIEHTLYYEALEDYFVKIYGWAWARYRYRKDAPIILSKKEDASEIF